MVFLLVANGKTQSQKEFFGKDFEIVHALLRREAVQISSNLADIEQITAGPSESIRNWIVLHKQSIIGLVLRKRLTLGDLKQIANSPVFSFWIWPIAVLRNSRRDWPVKLFKYLEFKMESIRNCPRSIQRLIQLRNLHLDHNNLTRLPNIFYNLTHLETLNLENNQISKFPESIGMLINLQHFSIRNNSSKKIPKIFDSLSELITVDGIKVPENWNSLFYNERYTLIEIWLNVRGLNCQISEKHIVTLNLSDCALSEKFPKDFELSALRTLDLSHNQIQMVPNLFNKIPDLETLTLNNNKIEVLPNSIGECRNLRFLNLRNNILTKLPENIGQLINLHFLT